MFETFLWGGCRLGPRPEPDLLPRELSESATRSLRLSGQRHTSVHGRGRLGKGG